MAGQIRGMRSRICQDIRVSDMTVEWGRWGLVVEFCVMRVEFFVVRVPALSVCQRRLKFYDQR